MIRSNLQQGKNNNKSIKIIQALFRNLRLYKRKQELIDKYFYRLRKQQKLDTSDKFFTQTQNPQKQKIMKAGNKLQNYWLICMQNSQYGGDLTQQQKSILKHVTDLQTNITTNQIELIITIQKNNLIQQGIFHRRLVLDNNGMPMSFQGQQPKFLQIKQQGIFSNYILTNTKNIDQMNIVFATLGNLVNEVIPYSLEYYLGAIQNGQFEEGQQDGEQDEEGEDQEA